MSEPDDALARLAARVDATGLRVPMALLLDALSPLDIIGSQLARFSLPLTGGTSAEPIALALADSAGWRELRRLLDEPPAPAP